MMRSSCKRGTFYLVAIVVTLFNSTEITLSFGMNLIKVPEDDPGQILCSLALLKKYFNSGESLSGSVLFVSLTTAPIHTQKVLLKEMHRRDDFPWTIVVHDTKTARATAGSAELHEKPQCYFLIIENLEDEDIEEIFEGWKTTLNWNPLAQFVVYLSSVEESDEEMTELMIEILLSFMNKKIYNVNVIGQNEENNFYYGKTVFPYHPDNNCGNRVISIETLDVCDYQDGNRDSGEDAESEEDEEVEDGGNDYSSNDGETEDEAEENELQDKEIGNEVRDDKENDNSENDIPAESESDDESKSSPKDYEESNINKSIHQNHHKRYYNSNTTIDDGESTSNCTSNAENMSTEESSKAFNDNDDEQRSGFISEENEQFSNNRKILKSIHQSRSRDNFQIDDQQQQQRESFENEMESDELDDSNASTAVNETKNGPKLYLEEICRALFLDKFPKDLSGCPLLAAYRPWEPYIFSEKEEEETENSVTESEFEIDSTKEPDYNMEGPMEEPLDYNEDYGGPSLAEDVNNGAKLNGIEYELLQTIADRLHISIDLQVENRNMYHLFQQLIDGDIEMVIGGIDEDPSISQYVSTTIPYHQDDLTWCVARARRSYNIFNFLASFSFLSWLLTFMTMLVASTMVAFMKHLLKLRLKYLHGFFSIMFRMLGIMFNQSMPLSKMPIPMRMIFALMFITSLLLVNAYQSFLVSTLTTPKSAYQISRMEEIYKYRMTIMGSVENVRHLNKDGEIFKYIREQFQMCYNIEECLAEAADSDNIAVAVSRHHSFYNPRIPRNRLYCFDRNENLYVYLVTMLLPKKFHLLHKINPVIQYVIESGHMQKWARDLDMRRRIQEERKHHLEEKFRSLTFDQIVGAFLFAGSLLGLAFVVFILEHWINWMMTKPRRTRIKIVRILHQNFLKS